jgi:CheY-like chemotaxis protein
MVRHGASPAAARVAFYREREDMPPIPLLICDDSNMARKQLLRALPADWDATITQAVNGREALQAVREGKGDVMLLDLTMPDMDGYQVLAALREQGLHSKVIVVSGDVQDQALRRVRELGALAFVKKPAEPEELRRVLLKAGLLEKSPGAALRGFTDSTIHIGFIDALREAINVAMGQAAAMLAKVLGVFIHLPVPNVNMLEASELHMVLADVQKSQPTTAICQGYIGGGIAGEAMLIFHDCDIADLARLMNRSALDYSDLEMLLDLSSVIIGACLSGLAQQLDVVFSQSHPQILGDHGAIDDLIAVGKQRWKKTLTVEISYALEGHCIHFDLLLLFTEDSVQLLRDKLDYLMN